MWVYIFSRSLVIRGIITEGKAVQMAPWNEKHCDERHTEIKTTMTELITAKNEHQERIAIMETILIRSESLFWKFFQPCRPWIIGAVIVGMYLFGKKYVNG